MCYELRPAHAKGSSCDQSSSSRTTYLGITERVPLLRHLWLVYGSLILVLCRSPIQGLPGYRTAEVCAYGIKVSFGGSETLKIVTPPSLRPRKKRIYLSTPATCSLTYITLL